MFTAGRRIFTAASNRVIARALLDPNSLKDLLALRNLKTSSKQAAVILSKLGGSIFILDDDAPSIPSKSSVEDTTSMNDIMFREREKSFEFFPKDPKIDLSMIPQSPEVPPLNTANINPNLFAQAQTQGGSGIMQNLSASERALLDPTEQVIAART